jgi:hypothetical protein
MIHINNIPGLGTRSFPDGTDPETIKATIDKELNYGQQEPGLAAGALTAFGRGINSAAQGLEQVGVGLGEKLGTQPQGASQAYAQGIQNERQQYEQGLGIPGQDPVASRLIGGKLPEAIGQSLPFLGLGAIAGEAIPAELAGSALLSRLGVNAATGAATTGLSPIEPGQSRLAQTGAGAVIGPLAGEVGNVAGKLIGKGVNAYRGEAFPDEYKSLMDLGQQYDIPLHANQLDPGLNPLAAHLRRGPFGLNPAEVAQGEKVGEGAKNFVQNMQDELRAGQYGGAGGIDSLKRAAAGEFGVKRQGSATALLERVNQDPAWTEIINNSKDVTKFNRQLVADKMADEMMALAGDKPIPLSNFKAALMEIDEKIGSQLKPDDPLKGVIDDLKAKVFPPRPGSRAASYPGSGQTQMIDPITGQPIVNTRSVPTGDIDPATGNPVLRQETETAMHNAPGIRKGEAKRTFDPATGQEIIKEPEFNFGQTRDLRTFLQKKVREGLQGTNAIIGDQENRLFQKLSSATDEDLNAYAQAQGGKLKNKMDAFNNYYRVNLGPYKNRELAAALNKTNPDDIYKNFIQTRTFEGDPKQLYNLLDNKGRKAVQFGMVDDAYKRAFDENSGTFSAPKFLNILKTRQGAKNVFFQGEDAKKLEGYTKLLSAVKTSSSAGGTPVTGAMNLPVGAAAALGTTGAAFGGPVGAAGLLGTAWLGGNGLRWLMTNPTGVKILLSSSKLKPNTKAFDALLVRAGNLAQTAATQQGASNATR